MLYNSWVKYNTSCGSSPLVRVTYQSLDLVGVDRMCRDGTCRIDGTICTRQVGKFLYGTVAVKRQETGCCCYLSLNAPLVTDCNISELGQLP